MEEAGGDEGGGSDLLLHPVDALESRGVKRGGGGASSLTTRLSTRVTVT
jgi:hypothetical protein